MEERIARRVDLRHPAAGREVRDDVELGCLIGRHCIGRLEQAMPLEGSAAVGTQHLAKPGIGERQHFEGEPQGRGRSTRTAAFE